MKCCQKLKEIEAMNERLKILRKTLELTQQQFGEEIGAKRNTIAVWECGAALPGNRAIKDICREFDINEVWLRTGEGKMMAPKVNRNKLRSLSQLPPKTSIRSNRGLSIHSPISIRNSGTCWRQSQTISQVKRKATHSRRRAWIEIHRRAFHKHL